MYINCMDDFVWELNIHQIMLVVFLMIYLVPFDDACIVSGWSRKVGTASRLNGTTER